MVIVILVDVVVVLFMMMVVVIVMVIVMMVEVIVVVSLLSSWWWLSDVGVVDKDCFHSFSAATVFILVYISADFFIPVFNGSVNDIDRDDGLLPNRRQPSQLFL